MDQPSGSLLGAGEQWKGMGGERMAGWELIRDDRDRQRLRNVLLEGAESPSSGVADTAYFETLRAGVRRDAKE